MFVHFNSTAVLDFFCLGDFSQSCSHNNLVKNRPDYTLFKAGGIFLNFASESIRTLFDTYVPKNNPDWHATTRFASDIKIAGINKARKYTREQVLS